MSEKVRFFVNGRPVDGNSGETVLSAISRWDADLGSQLSEGKRALSDSRGLNTPVDSELYNGAIFRVISNRQPEEIIDPFAD